MKFKDKIKLIFSKANRFVLSHKAVTIAVAIVIVVLIVILGYIKYRWDYSHKVVKTIDGKDYTQSQIDEIADWWQNDAKIENEGNTTMDN